MPIMHGVFSDRSDYEERFIPDYDKLGELVRYWKEMNLKIVLTSGSFDIIHRGHMAYLEVASQFGDLLVVGVDSDEKIKKRKGPNRPVVDEDERWKTLCHQRGVSVVTLKSADEQRWQLIKVVRPDVLVVSEDTSMTPEEIQELEENFCGEVKVMPRMAETTTSARLRKLFLDMSSRIKDALEEAFPHFISEVIERIKENV